MHVCVCVCVCVCMLCVCVRERETETETETENMSVEVRGQLVTLGSLLPPSGTRNQPQVIRLGGRCLYLLPHLADPVFCLLPVKA